MLGRPAGQGTGRGSLRDSFIAARRHASSSELLGSVRSITFNLNYDVITLNYDQSELRSIVARPFRNRELGPWAYFAKNEAS